MRHQIYDCFCYFNEDLLLELRLETLWNYVDYFVIVESVYTISGNPKPLNYKPSLFKKYLSKIRYLVVTDYPEGLSDAWRNERFQRNYIANGLLDAKPTDWIIISDVDEIPRPEAIALFNPAKFKRGDFEQDAYAYYFNNRCQQNKKNVLWYGSKITTYNHFKHFFKCAENVRSFKIRGILGLIYRKLLKKQSIQIIKNGGWHFTWIASIEKIILKIESYAHQEYNIQEYKSHDLIKLKIADGFDILNPNGRCKMQLLSSEFPDFLVCNREKFAQYLLT